MNPTRVHRTYTHKHARSDSEGIRTEDPPVLGAGDAVVQHRVVERAGHLAAPHAIEPE